jgi:hypothetical protein
MVMGCMSLQHTLNDWPPIFNIERCPQLGEQRKTSARSEHFAF